MYNYSEIKSGLHEARRLIDEWEEELKSCEKDLHKFYKKGHRRAGIRLRRRLKETINQIQLLRLDIRRLYTEREILKNTEHADDFKRKDQTPSNKL